MARAAREGRPQIVREMSADVRKQLARDEAHLELLDQLGAQSAITVPLVVRGTVVGVLGLLLVERERGFTDHDVRRAEALADRAAPAVDNARLHRELQLANRMKDEFLGIVSHELRTPLNAVLGWARLLQSGGLDEDRSRHALNAIYRNAQSQRQLIEDLLDASRIMSGKLRLEQRPLRLADVLEGALDAVRPAAEARSIGLVADLAAAGAAIVSGDSARLQQVFWNLLTNAVKFTPEGGSVRVDGRLTADWVEISITDTGVGISPAFLPYVFDRFRQADSTTTRAHGGLGLGLAIARHLAELHRGSIRVWSAGELQGATFTVRLPIDKAPASVAREEEPRTLPEASLPAPVRILVIDDDGDSRELLRAMLSGAGANVVVVPSAKAAIEHCLIERPDVVISDIGMPLLDGYAFLEQLRRLEESRGLPPVPAIAVTAYARADDRRRAIQAGFQEHIGKPVDPNALLQAVRQAIDRSDRDLLAGRPSH
jgi:signal transduction histidine kinase/ActR/RegA family two-component response regulator